MKNIIRINKYDDVGREERPLVIASTKSTTGNLFKLEFLTEQKLTDSSLKGGKYRTLIVAMKDSRIIITDEYGSLLWRYYFATQDSPNNG